MLPVTSHLVTLRLLVGLLPFSPKFVFSRRCACVVRPIRQTGLPVVSGAAKRKMVGQASTCRVARCVLHVYGRPGVCALLVVNIHQGLWFAVCRVCVCCYALCVCAVGLVGAAVACCGESSLTRCHTWPAMVLEAQQLGSALA